MIATHEEMNAEPSKLRRMKNGTAKIARMVRRGTMNRNGYFSMVSSMYGNL